MTRLQLGPITTISHSLQVSGLDNAGTATRSYSQSVRQAMDGLIAPLPPSPLTLSGVTQAGRGSCWLNSFGVLWGFFWLIAYIFTLITQSAMLFRAFPIKGHF